MDDGPRAYYIRPDFFDWGVYKPYGELILLGSGLLYLACFAACVLFFRSTAEQVGSPRIVLVAGLVGLLPMLTAIVESLDVQGSSRHYQERVHVPALTTVGVTVALAALLWLGVYCVRGRRGA